MTDATKPEEQTASTPYAPTTPAPTPEHAAAVDDGDAAKKQFAEDLAWKREHPNQALVRGANPKVGGEGG